MAGDDAHGIRDNRSIPAPGTGETGETGEAAHRGAPLIASWPRWLSFVAGEAALLSSLAFVSVSIAHAARSFSAIAPVFGIAWGVGALLTLAMLRAEEARLTRELRTARSGTLAIRGMVLARRERARAPVILRFFSTTFGTSALLLAEGERGAALDALAANSPIMVLGRLQRLRAVIEADAARAVGTPAALESCIETLRAAPPIGNTEADRYGTHVLVKAVLGLAAGDLAEDLAAELSRSRDEEVRVYAVWLRVWFDADAAADSPPQTDDEPRPPPVEPTHENDGELRLALLLARSQGAEALVKKLEARLVARSPLRSPAVPST